MMVETGIGILLLSCIIIVGVIEIIDYVKGKT